MSSVVDIASRLRSRILRGLHLGEIHPGDRLPSTREVADQLDEDHRSVAEAYRLLSSDGLVEVRPRSGVYVARPERLGEGEGVLRDTARWMRDVVTEAWRRHIRLADLPELVHRCLAARRLTCLCVESAEDPAFAISNELSRDFALEVSVALINRPPETRGASSECLPPDLLERLSGSDLVVTTAFHASPLWSFLKANAPEQPLVVVSLNPDWRMILQDAMRDEGLTVVHLDSSAPERFRLLLEAGPGDSLRFARLDDRSEWLRRGDEGRLYFTAAARARADLEGIEALRPPAPLLSEEAARDLLEVIIRLNLEARAE